MIDNNPPPKKYIYLYSKTIWDWNDNKGTISNIIISILEVTIERETMKERSCF